MKFLYLFTICSFLFLGQCQEKDTESKGKMDLEQTLSFKIFGEQEAYALAANAIANRDSFEEWSSLDFNLVFESNLVPPGKQNLLSWSYLQGNYEATLSILESGTVARLVEVTNRDSLVYHGLPHRLHTRWNRDPQNSRKIAEVICEQSKVHQEAYDALAMSLSNFSFNSDYAEFVFGCGIEFGYLPSDQRYDTMESPPKPLGLSAIQAVRTKAIGVFLENGLDFDEPIFEGRNTWAILREKFILNPRTYGPDQHLRALYDFHPGLNWPDDLRLVAESITEAPGYRELNLF